ncbi:D-aminoacid aminotransferase-like PLP-dependent enzyme [Colletotrichum falcatum]|nr:D-aminoacid aminotransferase-like PLP-dependent enzyme [Colletotrichum falcatum]
MYNTTTGRWTVPKFVKSPTLSIHVLAPGLHCARRDPDGEILIFRPDVNAARMRRSATFDSMPEVPEDVFLESVQLAVRGNAEYFCPHEVEGSLYIRPFQFCLGTQIGAIKALVLDEFDRAATRGSGVVKIGGNYAPVIRWIAETMKKGYTLLLYLGSQTQTEVEEFSTSGFAGIQKGEKETTVVIADSKSALESITADSSAKIAVSLGWRVEKRTLPTLKEVLVAGTASGLAPVSCIHRKSTKETFKFIPDGPAVEPLWGRLKSTQNGTAIDGSGWCHKLLA